MLPFPPSLFFKTQKNPMPIFLSLLSYEVLLFNSQRIVSFSLSPPFPLSLTSFFLFFFLSSLLSYLSIWKSIGFLFNFQYWKICFTHISLKVWCHRLKDALLNYVLRKKKSTELEFNRGKCYPGSFAWHMNP